MVPVIGTRQQRICTAELSLPKWHILAHEIETVNQWDFARPESTRNLRNKPEMFLKTVLTLGTLRPYSGFALKS
jgi:hypothetical protein